MSTQFINEGAQSLNPYTPGLSIDNARRLYQRDDFVKLASNENAYGPAPAAAEVLSRPWKVERYPDPDQRGLTEALAGHYGIDAGNIVVGAGSSELLDRLARLLLCPGKKAVYSQYAFSLYRQYTLGCNAEPVEVAAHPPGHRDAYGHDLAAMAEAVDERTALIYIASPNNPTGSYSRQKDLRALLDSIPADTVVVVDQAYAEYAYEMTDDYPDLLDCLQKYPNLVITRTFSKIYALAGLRVGYAIADGEIANWLRRIRQPFNVSQLAQEAAIAALGDQAHVRRCAVLNSEEIRCFATGLALLGLRTIPTTGNFVSFELPTSASALYERLMSGGIIARALSEYGLDNHLRLTLGLAEENERALAIITEEFSK